MVVSGGGAVAGVSGGVGGGGTHQHYQTRERRQQPLILFGHELVGPVAAPLKRHEPSKSASLMWEPASFFLV